MTRVGSQRGFTLIEVLVALTIVAFGLAALFTTVNQSVRSSDYLREKTLAGWIALNKITEMRMARQPPAEKNQSGTVEYAGRTWRWELKVVPSGVQGIIRMEARSALESSPKNVWPGLAVGFTGDALAGPDVKSPYDNVPGGPGGVGGGGAADGGSGGTGGSVTRDDSDVSRT